MQARWALEPVVSQSLCLSLLFYGSKRVEHFQVLKKGKSMSAHWTDEKVYEVEPGGGSNSAGPALS